MEDVIFCSCPSLGDNSHGWRQVQQPSGMVGDCRTDGVPFVGMGYEVGWALACLHTSVWCLCIYKPECPDNFRADLLQLHCC